MKPMFTRKAVQERILWTLVLIVVMLVAHPIMATDQKSAIDIAAIDSFVGEQMQRHGIPGLALGIVEGDQVAFLQGYGKADDSGRIVTAQTPFLLASVSKPLTALAMMQLVEAGQVELDAPVQRYVPEFRMLDAEASAQITVRQLLLHTSGIPVTACDTLKDAQTLAQYVAELQTVELGAPVGARHDYCSGNYNVLGRIVERVSGQSFAEYMQQHIFAPLEMQHSYTSEQTAMQDGLAQGHQWLFGWLVPTHHPFNPSQLPSGYLISSAEDMTHFLIGQLNGGRFGNTTILSPAAIEMMHAPAVSIGPEQGFYGLGWRMGALGGVPIVFHYGDNFDYHTLLVLEPESGRGAVILINANNVLATFTAFKEIEEGVVRLLAGEAPVAASSWSFPMRYLMVDLVAALLFTAVLWPLVQMRQWMQFQQQRQGENRLRPWLIGLRLVWDFGLPLTLLIGARLALHGMGAQSWIEGLSVFPDIGLWLWAISLLMLLTGVIRLVLFLRLLRSEPGKQEVTSASVASGLQHHTSGSA